MDGGGGGADAPVEPLEKVSVSKTKKGTTQGMHELAALLVKRSRLDLAEGLFRQQLANADTLPELAAHGLLLEITFVRDLLSELGL